MTRRKNWSKRNYKLLMAKRVVVACEFSGTVREAFRKRGFHAVSVDLLPAADGMNGWHFQTDILKFLATSAPFDLMIAHPPCTYLCNSGVCWLHPATGHRTKKNYTDAKCLFRWINLQQSVIFFNALKDANIPNIAIENPIPHKFATGSWATRGVGQQCRGIGKYDQIIQPWQFGHPETKATCLWLK